jgi:hypothetical protein
MSDQPQPAAVEMPTRLEASTAVDGLPARTYVDGRVLLDFASTRNVLRRGTEIDRRLAVVRLADGTTGKAEQDGGLLADRIESDPAKDVRLAAIKVLVGRADQDPQRVFDVLASKLTMRKRDGRDQSEAVRRYAADAALRLKGASPDAKFQLLESFARRNDGDSQEVLVRGGEILLNDCSIPTLRRTAFVSELCQSRHQHVRIAGLRLASLVDEVGSQQAAALFRDGILDPSATVAAERSASSKPTVGSAMVALRSVDEIVQSPKLPINVKLELLEKGVTSPHPDVNDKSVRACIALHKRQTMKYVSSTVRVNAADEAVPNEDVRAWIDSVDKLSDAAKEVLKKRFP